MTAIEDYSQALKIDPHNADALIARGKVYLDQAQPSSAANDFKSALALHPDSPEAKTLLADSLAHIQQIAGSATKPIALPQVRKSTLSKAVLSEIAQVDAATLIQKGYTALKQGDHEFALAALTRAVSQRPNDANARQYLFYTLVALGDADQAEAQWNALEHLGVQTFPNDLKCTQSIASCGNHQIAGGCWEHLIVKYANDTPALITIAKTCAADYKEKAIEACDKGLEHASDLNSVRELNKLRISLSSDGDSQPTQPGAPQSTTGKYVGR